MIAVIVGMKSEAALLPAGILAGCAGGVAARAAALAQGFLDQGASGLLSFGIAGGLDPALAPGALIVAGGVEYEDGTIIASDAAWSRRLALALDHARSGLLFGADRAIATAADKAALFSRNGALAVDMESGAMARMAAAKGVPFAVLRAVADPADRALPLSALAGLDAKGNTRPLAVMRQLLARPGDLPGLIRVGRDSQTALSALRHALQVVGPTLGM